MEEIKVEYRQLIEQYSQEKALVEKKILWVSVLRLCVFILIILSGWFAFKMEQNILWLVLIILIIAFLFLMKHHAALFNRKSFMSRLIQINQEEIAALDGDFSYFASGFEFEIPNHDFSLDLDVFGQKSIFQMINRTSTSYGIKKLANWFNEPLLEKKEILKRQSAAAELAGLLNYRQYFRANGLAVEEKTWELDFLNEWQNQENLFYPKSIFKFLLYFIPAINLAAILAYSFSFISVQLLVLSLILTLGFVGIYQKKIHTRHNLLGKRTALLEKYIEIFKLVESQIFNDELLQDLQAQLKNNGKKAYDKIQGLSNILSALDTRLNVFVSIPLNAVFIWDIRQIYRMERWKSMHANELNQWFEVIANLEALQSIGNLSYNHPHWIFPKISEEEQWKFQKIKHPLMPSEQCVANDFMVNKIPHLKVITGANMAGKSTFLRTIGSNLLLAMIGAPVHAELMHFYPIQVMSSLRTTDSLAKSESYFYAEIKRLQLIMDRLRSGEQLFVLLDEILKGTNSKDKEEGSRALLLQLIKLKAVGIIATHDLSLGKMMEDNSEWIENQCFEVGISNEELIFDYTIRPGIAQNMNASFLLKKMGIVE